MVDLKIPSHNECHPHLAICISVTGNCSTIEIDSIAPSVCAASVSLENGGVGSEDLRLSGSIIRKSRFIFTKELRTIRQKSGCLNQ